MLTTLFSGKMSAFMELLSTTGIKTLVELDVSDLRAVLSFLGVEEERANETTLASTVALLKLNDVDKIADVLQHPAILPKFLEIFQDVMLPEPSPTQSSEVEPIQTQWSF